MGRQGDHWTILLRGRQVVDATDSEPLLSAHPDDAITLLRLALDQGLAAPTAIRSLLPGGGDPRAARAVHRGADLCRPNRPAGARCPGCAAMPSSDSPPVHGFGPRPAAPACDFCSKPGAVVFEPRTNPETGR